MAYSERNFLGKGAGSILGKDVFVLKNNFETENLANLDDNLAQEPFLSHSRHKNLCLFCYSCIVVGSSPLSLPKDNTDS